MAAVGDAVLIDSGPQGKHLHVIIWGPIQVPWLASHDLMILVGITTMYQNAPHDPGCVLQGGEHPFISHPSYAFYRRLRTDTAAHVDAMVQQGLFVAHSPASSQLVKQLRIGLCASKLVDRRFKALVNCPPPAVLAAGTP